MRLLPKPLRRRQKYLKRKWLVGAKLVPPLISLSQISEFLILHYPIDDSNMKKSIHTKEYAYFVERLCKARKEAGLTQVQVAKKLKRPQSYISTIESGQQRVDVIELQKFAKMYKRDLDYFFK
ncbi:MAG: helix-turn-helix transcriptional regulator [Candidatus Paceibacterota bacterium]